MKLDMLATGIIFGLAGAGILSYGMFLVGSVGAMDPDAGMKGVSLLWSGVVMVIVGCIAVFGSLFVSERGSIHPPSSINGARGPFGHTCSACVTPLIFLSGQHRWYCASCGRYF